MIKFKLFRIAHLAPYSAIASMHKATKQKKFHISTELLQVTSMNETQGLLLWLSSYTVPNTILLASAAAGSNWPSNAGRYTILLFTFAAVSLVYWQEAWMQQSFMQLKIKEIKGSKERYLLGQNTTCSVAFCRNKWCSVEQFMGLDLVLGCWQSFTFQIFEKKVSEMRRACSQTATTGRKVFGAWLCIFSTQLFHCPPPPPPTPQILSPAWHWAWGLCNRTGAQRPCT